MKDKLPAKLRAVTLFLCCAVLTLLGGGAQHKNSVTARSFAGSLSFMIWRLPPRR